MKYRLAKGKCKEQPLIERQDCYAIYDRKDDLSIQFEKEYLQIFLEQGIIEAVPELEYTKEDMLDFAYAYSLHFSGGGRLTADEFLQQWQEQRNAND